MRIKSLKKYITYKGSKSNKSNCAINYTQADKYFINLKLDSLQYIKKDSYGVDKKTCNIIKKQWQKAGYDKKLLKNIGFKKALQILNNL